MRKLRGNEPPHTPADTIERTFRWISLAGIPGARRQIYGVEQALFHKLAFDSGSCTPWTPTLLSAPDSCRYRLDLPAVQSAKIMGGTVGRCRGFLPTPSESGRVRPMDFSLSRSDAALSQNVPVAYRGREALAAVNFPEEVRTYVRLRQEQILKFMPVQSACSAAKAEITALSVR